MMDKVQAEAATWTLANEWADGLDLEYAGVSLADCMQYNLLTVTNRLLLQHLDAQNKPTETTPAEPITNA